MGLLARTFPALRYRDFRLLVTGLFVSIAGFWVFVVTQAWLALEITGSNTWVGIVSSAQSLPFIFISLWAGVLADRVDRRKLMLATRCGVVALMLLEALLAAAGLIDRSLLIAFALGLGVLTSLDIPTRQSLVADLVPKEHVGNAVAIQNAAFNLTSIVGPATGATLLALGGAPWSFAVTALGNAALVLVVLAMRVPPPKHHAGASPLQQLREGLRYIFSTEIVRWLLLLGLFVTIFGYSYQVLLPSFARDVFGAGEGGYGTLTSVAGIGALVGSLSVVVLANRGRKGPLLFAGPSCFALALIGLALSPSLLVAAGALLLAGGATSIYFTSHNTVILTTTPEHLRGRVMSVTMFVWGLTPLGSLVAGLIGDHWGVRTAVAVNATVVLTAVIVVFGTRRAVRAL